MGGAWPVAAGALPRGGGPCGGGAVDVHDLRARPTVDQPVPALSALAFGWRE